MDNNSILVFKAITSFITDLHNEFGSKYKGITLYHRLLEKTGLVHTGPIMKHIECFTIFFSKNEDAMKTQEASKLVETRIIYSERVYVDVLNVLQNTDKDSSLIIWQHLLNIWGLIDPSSHAKNTLKELLKEDESKESDFLSNIIQKVEQSVDPSKLNTNNPMEMVSSLMQSGTFNDLISGMQKGLSDGSLDMGKLMGSVQGMMSKMSPDGQMPPELAGMMNMMGPMLNNMGKK
jgi:hypothetical protein